MAGKSRSPNYPSLSLGEAIEAVGPVYAKERRAKFPRMSLATHLGYGGLNGRALAKIGALRAYRLIEGREDTLAVSPLGIALLDAPRDSEDYIHALHEAFNAPPLFSRILEEHGDEQPSPETLRWWLSKQGYVGEAADKALRVYLASAELVNSIEGAYDSGGNQSGPVVKKNAHNMSADEMLNELMPFPKPKQPPVNQAGGEQAGLAMGVHERILTSGILSRQATFRVVVSGPVGEAEIDRLLKKLEMDKEILADPDPESMPSGDSRDYQREHEEGRSID